MNPSNEYGVQRLSDFHGYDVNLFEPDQMTDRSQATIPSANAHLLWLPFALIATALVLMLTTPLIIGSRIQRLRRHEGNVIAPALVWVNDLEAAIGAETAARSEEAEKTTDSTDARKSAETAQTNGTRDLSTLDSLVRKDGPDAIVLLAKARVAIESWRQEQSHFVLAGKVEPSDAIADRSAARSRRWKSVQTALSAVQRVDDDLGNQSQAELAEISRLERLNDFVPLLLVPLALIGLAALAWTARRTRQLSREASAGRTAAEQALAAKSALMRGVTHDLKNPLGAARGYAELIADGTFGPVPEAQAEIMKRLQSLIDVTLDTLNDLVELSRADAGMLTVSVAETDITALTRDLVDDYRPIGKRSGVSITLDISDDVASDRIMRTDPNRVRQVLGNLLSNSFKYASDGRAVRMLVRQAVDPVIGELVVIQVSDRGPGIPAELHERVFEEFFRVPNASTAVNGTGVGLAIARRVARLLGGDLRLEDTDGGGATFTLLLPVTTKRHA